MTITLTAEYQGETYPLARMGWYQVTLTLTRTGGHYLAECETRPRKG